MTWGDLNDIEINELPQQESITHEIDTIDPIKNSSGESHEFSFASAKFKTPRGTTKA